MSGISFQKLFSLADLECQIYRPIDVIQADTTDFDRIADAGDNDDPNRSSKIIVEEPGILVLRSTIRHVPMDVPQNTAPKYLIQNAPSSHTERMKSDKLHDGFAEVALKGGFLIPEIDWQTEVDSIMRDEIDCIEEMDVDEDTIKSRDGSHRNDHCSKEIAFKGQSSDHGELFMRRLFIRDVAPFNCFEPDSVSFSSGCLLKDDLDVLLPNPVLPAIVDMSDFNLDENYDEYRRASLEGLNTTDNKEFSATSSNGNNNSNGNSSSATSAGSTASGAHKEESSASSFPSLLGAGAVTTAAASTTGPVVYLSRAEKAYKMTQEKLRRISSVAVGFDAAASLQRESGAKRPRDDAPLLRGKGRSTVAALNHNILATSHKNTKMDLLEGELKYFHRPRLANARKMSPWQITLRDVSRKDKGSGSAADDAGRGQVFTDFDKKDISLVNGGDFMLLEYIEERPPVMVNLGMASAMLNYYRAADDQDQDERKRREEQNVSQKRRTGLTSTCRVPRHVRLLLQQRNIKQGYEHDANSPRLEVGDTKVLGADDESPFLGDLTEGEIQQAFSNNLFKAPIFRHEPNPCDFLLIRLKMTNTLYFTVKEIPRIFVCGQMEPQKVVFRPNKGMNKLQEKMFMLAAARYFNSKTDSSYGDFKDIQRSILNYSRRKRQIVGQGLRKALSYIADEVDDAVEGKKYRSKDLQEYAPEIIQKTFHPEDVCLQESCNACELRLAELGIEDVELTVLEQWLVRMKNLKEFREDRLGMAMRLSLEQKRTPKGPTLEKLVKILKDDVRRLAERIRVGQFIFEKLASAPWNTTEAFVRSHVMKDGLGRMELQGTGDPSGRGEGFAFLRLIREVAVSKKSNTPLVNTKSDLRRLTKEDAITLLVAIGESAAKMRELPRWDRVLLIRERSTQMKNIGVSSLLHKYARSDAASAVEGTQKSFRDRCQQIWKRQKEALSRSGASSTAVSSSSTAAVVNAEGNNEDEEDDDDDEDEEEGEEGEFEKVIASRSQAASALALEEAGKVKQKADAAAEEKKALSSMGSFFSTLGTGAGGPRIHARITGAESVEVASSSSAKGAEKDDPFGADWIRPLKAVKRITRTVHEDGTEVIKVQFIISDSEVQRVERETLRNRRERESRKLGGMFGDDGVADRGGDDEEERTHKSSHQSLTLKMGLMQRKVNKERVQDAKGDNELDDGGFYKPTKSTLRAAPSTKTYRLPHVALAARFEKEIIGLWNSRFAGAFQYPVPRTIRGYYEKIRNPISLLDIRNRNAEYKYSTAQMLIDDVQLLLSNARSFNGDNCEISSCAEKLVSQLINALNHEKTHFGIQGDVINVLEEAIKKKFVYLKRASISFGGLNSRAGFGSSSTALPVPVAATSASSSSSGSAGGGGGVTVKPFGASGGGVSASLTVAPSSTLAPVPLFDGQTLGASSGTAGGLSGSMSSSGSSGSSSSNGSAVKGSMPPPSLTIPARVNPSNPVPTPLPSTTTAFPAPAGAADKEDEDDFTLLLGMDEDDSSGDEEVLEEG